MWSLQKEVKKRWLISATTGRKCVGSADNGLYEIGGKGERKERKGGESAMVRLLPRPCRVAALLSGRRGRSMANYQARGSGVAAHDQSERAIHVFAMSASHTTPNPSTGLALGGVPTEA